ncbi:MAG: hypothetical protein ACLFUA_09345 [Spirochaetales bacterium]
MSRAEYASDVPVSAREVVEIGARSPCARRRGPTRPLGALARIAIFRRTVVAPLLESTGGSRAVWFNVPGVNGSRTLPDVFEMNRSELQATLD